MNATPRVLGSQSKSLCLSYFLQPPMGDRHQSCNAEVPKPHEPQCGWGGRPRQERGRPGTAPQQKTTKHRLGSSIHSQIGE